METVRIRDPYHPQHYPLLVVISGPSGVGKDSVVKRLQEREYPFHFVVTATSRPPRSGEVHGVDYVFVTEAEFEAMIAQDELLEHAIVYGQYKGVPKSQIRQAFDSGKDVIMRVDVQGAATIKRIAPQAVLIFLSAASEEELLNRLCGRGTEDVEQLRRRAATIHQEMEHLAGFDYIVVNSENQLDAAVDAIIKIIESEHCRVRPRRVVL